MAKSVAECPSQGSLGLELDLLLVPATGPAPARPPAKARATVPQPLNLPSGPVHPAPAPDAGTEALIQVSLDQEAHTWRACVLVVGPGGELLDNREEAGRIELKAQLDPGDSDPFVLPRGYDLLGIAVDRGFALLEGLEIAGNCQAVLEASTHANATLSGRLRDWIHEGYFEPGAAPRFPYAHEAWGRVARALWPAQCRPMVKVRWVY